ncbi:archaeal proteasome endopeptidase complex subunit beta [Picrophilus oshimae]|uniref:Proteasome subunit beta n=2 Tax=Picrophilus torridus (strain ATCC 700027 / DSM 9790 / JCM 10055 / NBRC 100828 / KAW 2/3) TaxID=1122961 RepID=PSB_PICTO|nr:archaeal proteasome endopeptidase complex subunit beta [Picrophilus oshimae]Q6L181.1 RecName: Full=Proteasome subunit beta; AltName: Full=20S proteasome beta subunit; AltName: Full=Proteasome core protein PsmB; Flags: Precursor [Picrophilus oshimae DSM 9789]AAT43271.1 proteasome beta subunit [Picrophilus oshimae DSM 9789]SMD30422.1 proteasome endopeptidase complex, beta component Threonine peptidase. MEROPS family T01A [Picrophilus oshimae DSM 9789]
MEVLKTGTTTVGITAGDYVIMGTDSRATMENFISNKNAQKLYQIDNYAAMTIAGLVGDAQVLVRYMKAEMELYRVQRKVSMPIDAAATLLSNMLNQTKFYPYMVQLLVGGYDTKPHIFSIDAAGGSVEDIYASTGSGSPFVYGVLEAEYQKNMSLDDGINLVIKAISAAKQRDSASGNMLQLGVVDPKKGFYYLSEDEILSRLKKLKLQL